MKRPLNIILKAFDGPRHAITATEAFRGQIIGTCIWITNKQEHMPDIQAQEMRWMSGGLLRDGRYPDVDWTEIAPLDEEIIDNMRHAEAAFLSMVERYAKHGDIPYNERKRQYLEHLRFWNHTLTRGNIDLCLLNHAPHQCYDLVMYELCKLHGVPCYHLERCYSVEGVMLVKDFLRSSEQLPLTIARLKEEYADATVPVPLSPSYEEFFRSQTQESDETPWFARKIKAQPARRSFLARWWIKAIDLLRRKPEAFLKAVVSPAVWTSKLRQHRTALYYDAHTEEPDLSQPYVYLPLQMQPEEGMSPRGGAFENQELMAQLLAPHLPEGVRIYVKEHPNQGELFRSEAFYRSLLDLPSVTFVPRTFDTFTLIRRSIAVATATGTAGFEGLFRGKPCIMFGHRWCQYAPGVHMIRTEEDCKRAIDSIFRKKEVPALRDLRIFLKAIDLCSVPFEGGPTEGKASPEERAKGMGIMMREALAPLFTH